MKLLNLHTVLLGLSAFTLLYFGVPRFLASVWIAAGDPIYRDLNDGVELTGDDINNLIESRETALKLVEWPRAATDLGSAYYVQNPSPEGTQKAITSIERGLKLAPVSAFAWQRLASLQSLNPDSHEEALKSWDTARNLALHEPALLYDRIRIGIILYRTMTDEQRLLLRMDTERAYAKSRGGFKRYGRTNNLLEWFKFLLRDEEKTAYLNR